jgi:hypothetical protein
MECARNLLNLLFEGGAAQAIGVNVGKYGRQRYVITPEALHTSNAYDPVNHSDSSLKSKYIQAHFITTLLLCSASRSSESARW